MSQETNTTAPAAPEEKTQINFCLEDVLSPQEVAQYKANTPDGVTPTDHFLNITIRKKEATSLPSPHRN